MTTPTLPHRDPGTPQATRYPDVHCVNRRSRARQSGFTLIEILVAISIIALLVGLITAGAVVAMGGSQRSRTIAMCQSLLAAHDEYRSKSGQTLNHDGNAPIDWAGGTFNQNAPGFNGSAGGGGLSSSERFVVGCLLYDSSGESLRSAVQGRSALTDKDGDGFLEIRDPWDNELAFRSRNDQTGSFDGINNNLLPANRDPIFVSPGQDGDFATTDDNIESTEIGS